MIRRKRKGCVVYSIERWDGGAMFRNDKKKKKRTKNLIKPHKQRTEMLSLEKVERPNVFEGNLVVSKLQ